MDYQIRNAKDFAECGSRIVNKYDELSIATINDIHGLRTAATQFSQAAQDLHNLIGALEYQAQQRHVKK